MTEKYLIPKKIKEEASITFSEYEKLYKSSIEDPDKFWAEQAETLNWIKKFKQVKKTNFSEKINIKWFSDGVLNASYNCLDRHLDDKGSKPAIIWEGDNPKESKVYTFRELYKEVCKLANAMKDLGIKKGDRVTIYLPMIPEAAISMLACSRIGAVHSVVFGGFSPESLRNRIKDCESTTIITANEGIRSNKKIPLLKNVKESISNLNFVKNILVIS